MWEGDVCCNHPRNPLQGDEIKTRLGEGLAGYPETRPPLLTVHHFLPVFCQRIHSGISQNGCSHLMLFSHISPHICNPDRFRGTSSCFIFMHDSQNESCFVQKMEHTKNPTQSIFKHMSVLKSSPQACGPLFFSEKRWMVEMSWT